MALGDDSWLVVDSEDEAGLLPADGLETLDHSAAAGASTTPDVSIIQTASFPPDRPPPRGVRSPSTLADESLFTPPPARTDSTIGHFTSMPSPSGPPPPRPRPRPRVVIRKPVTNDGADVPNTSSSHISGFASTTTRTNDSIQPASSTSFGFSEVAGDAYSSLDIAERAKMRSRKKAPSPKKINPPEMNEVIELTSDEDEMNLKPKKRQKKQPNPKPKAPAKPRPKPTLRTKQPAVVPDSSPQNKSVAQNPQSSPAKDTSSELPPSTFPTIPPSTPPQAQDREPTPFSSPLVTTRKRKRPRPPIVEDDDEMDITGSKPAGGPPPLAEPPPFFAPSSSSFPADSGIEMPPVEPPSRRGKKKQASSKKGTQAKMQNKGKKGKNAEMANTVAEPVEECSGITQEPFTPAACHSPTVSHSPDLESSAITKKTSKSVAKKGKAREIDLSEEEEEPVLPLTSDIACTSSTREEGQKIKENLRPDELSPPKRDPPERTSTTPGLQGRSFAVKSKPTPMSELIRRVNSQPSSPFPNATRTYSPFLKSSRTMLAKIAPLHPNRRTPPPPLPRPPPPKKTKKQIEMEERIEEELSETVDGWSCLTDEERKTLRRARIDAELGFE